PFPHVGSNQPHAVMDLRARDIVGNQAAPMTFKWRVDTAVPDTVLLAGPAPTASSTEATFLFLDTAGA
ncbi:unnamed protein product, partial [Discosporangium mesarthrocarpum]